MIKILIVMFVVAPAAAQTAVRIPAPSTRITPSLPSKITNPSFRATFDSTRLGAPALRPNVAVINQYEPTPSIPAALISRLATVTAPDGDSPLSVIRDASADETKKTAALDWFFENSAPSNREALAVTALSNASSAEKSINEASPVPEWFSASGLSYTLMKKSSDGLLMAVLRQGRYELGVFIDKKGSSQAIFTKYALNPMGTPLREEVSLRTVSSRRAVAEILRDAQAENPVDGPELAALKEALAYLDGIAGARN